MLSTLSIINCFLSVIDKIGQGRNITKKKNTNGFKFIIYFIK